MNIFIDFDGTVVNSDEAVYRCYIDCCKKLEIKPDTRDDFFDMRKLGLYKRPIIRSMVNAHFKDGNYKKYNKIFPSMIDVIKKLKRRGNTIILITRSLSNKSHIGKCLKDNKLTDYVDHVICTTNKVKAIKKSKMAYKGHIFIADSEYDFKTAKKLKMRLIAVMGTRSLEILNLHNPEYIVMNKANIPKIVRNIQRDNKKRWFSL